MKPLDKLIELLGPEGLLTDGDLERYRVEPRGRYRGCPVAVARPESTAQLAQVVKICAQAGLPIVAQGGHTGLVGGAIAEAGELVVSFERMRRIRGLSAVDGCIVAEAGCTLDQVNAAAAGIGMFYPVDLASGGSATVGGTLATNAGGHLTIRYGNTRAQVLGLEVVLADGRVLDMRSALPKDNSGYDLRQLFVGCEGTLGLITTATLRLAPKPRQSLTALAACDSLQQALELLGRLRLGLGETLSACEFMPRLALEFVHAHRPDLPEPFEQLRPWQVLIQADSSLAGDWLSETGHQVFEAALSDRLAGDFVLASSQTQAGQLWALRESIPAAQRCGGISLKHDVSVPISSIADFVEQATAELERAVPGIRPCIFGHLGDGNLHFNLSQPADMSAEDFAAREPECNRIVFGLVTRHGGSIAAEHGIGRLRRDLLARSQPLKAELVARIRQALDPNDLLNPGKVTVPDSK